MPAWLDWLVLGATDALYAALPRRPPALAELEHLKLISHRGERDGQKVFENTFDAFDPLRGSGVWGLELDVRWTRDLWPVVIHDPDLSRMWNDPAEVATLDRDELHRRHPRIPQLDELAARYGAEFHLMIELKPAPLPDRGLQSQRLGDALLAATRGYHLICMQPALLDELSFVPPERTIGLARTNLADISREALASKRAGIGAHYALVNGAHIEAHHAAQQKIGTGFPASPAVLFREAARGVDWIFTNRALALRRFVDRLLAL